MIIPMIANDITNDIIIGNSSRPLKSFKTTKKKKSSLFRSLFLNYRFSTNNRLNRYFSLVFRNNFEKYWWTRRIACLKYHLCLNLRYQEGYIKLSKYFFSTLKMCSLRTKEKHLFMLKLIYFWLCTKSENHLNNNILFICIVVIKWRRYAFWIRIIAEFRGRYIVPGEQTNRFDFSY